MCSQLKARQSVCAISFDDGTKMLSLSSILASSTTHQPMIKIEIIRCNLIYGMQDISRISTELQLWNLLLDKSQAFFTSCHSILCYSYFCHWDYFLLAVTIPFALFICSFIHFYFCAFFCFSIESLFSFITKILGFTTF